MCKIKERGVKIVENKNNNQDSPSWELFWQEHGQSLLKQEEEEEEKNKESAKINKHNKENKNIIAQKSRDNVQHKHLKEDNLKKNNKIDNNYPGNDVIEKSSSQKQKTIIIISICIFLFLVISIGTGYFIFEKLKTDKEELTTLIDQKTSAIKEENEQAFDEMNDQLIDIESQMDDLVTILEDTDDAIIQSGADSREAMSEKIEELDKQLSKLKESLEILMEDQNAR